jgi:hypothetical protein
MEILLYEGDMHTQTQNLQTHHLVRLRDKRNDYLQSTFSKKKQRKTGVHVGAQAT